jgi:catechol-2,3-dioxygenase
VRRKIELTTEQALPTIPGNETGMDVPAHLGLRHVALRVTNLKRSRAFYEQLLAMKVVWEPDADNVYFSSGIDNLALHQIGSGELASYRPPRGQLLDHMGVIVESPQAVDRMYASIAPKIASLGGAIAKEPKQHRDGSYSFYFSDPDGNIIQALYEPTISKLQWVSHD